MFTAKLALYLSANAEEYISPALNVESLYIEKSESLGDGIKVNRYSIVKHFPVYVNINKMENKYVENICSYLIADISENKTIFILNQQLADSSMFVYYINTNFVDNTETIKKSKLICANVKKFDLSAILYNYLSKSILRNTSTNIIYEQCEYLKLDASTQVKNLDSSLDEAHDKFEQFLKERIDNTIYSPYDLKQKAARKELICGNIYKMEYDPNYGLPENTSYFNFQNKFIINLKAISNSAFDINAINTEDINENQLSDDYLNNLLILIDVSKYGESNYNYCVDVDGSMYIKTNILQLYYYDIVDEYNNKLLKYTYKTAGNISLYIKCILQDENVCHLNDKDIICSIKAESDIKFYSVIINNDNKLANSDSLLSNIIPNTNNIIYMKDKYGNEAQYDFLNRKIIVNTNDDTKAFYTFSSYDTDNNITNAIFLNDCIVINNKILDNTNLTLFYIKDSTCANNIIELNNYNILLDGNHNNIINNKIMKDNKHVIISGSNNIVHNGNINIYINGNNNEIFNENYDISINANNSKIYNKNYNIKVINSANVLTLINNSSIYVNNANVCYVGIENVDISTFGNNMYILNNKHTYLQGDNNTIINCSIFSNYDRLNAENNIIMNTDIAINDINKPILDIRNNSIINSQLQIDLLGLAGNVQNNKIINSKFISLNIISSNKIINSNVDATSLQANNNYLINTEYNSLNNNLEGNYIVNSSIISTYNNDLKNCIVQNSIFDGSIGNVIYHKGINIRAKQFKRIVNAN